MRLAEATANKVRMINHWDNIDGTVERGYAGKSIFFADGQVTQDLHRVTDYARLLASVGVNAVSLNNVNVTRASARLLTPEHLPRLARLAEVFRRYGIKLFISISFASPMVLSGCAPPTRSTRTSPRGGGGRWRWSTSTSPTSAGSW